MPRQLFTIGDPPETEIDITGVPLDSHFAAFRNGTLLEDGPDYVLGPGLAKITLQFTASPGDKLEFRRL